MKYQSVKGMEDILPADAGVWQWLERIARRELEACGYREIRTPILEDTSVFVRSIGEETDIVTKEMYTFKDKKERSLTLRPEGTAPIVRAYIEHSLDKASQVSRLYYIGPMFRSERPQKGRARQFHQIGAEVFGSSSPYADAEIIGQLDKMLKQLGLDGYTVKMNSLGCAKDKERFSDKLKGYLRDKKARLCEDCKVRINKNVLRVLDCKVESCREVVKGAPDIVETICGECGEKFERLKDCLKKMKVGFEEAKNLVRGLDYYTGAVFEVTHPALGGQDALAAGGRYDNLVKDLGGPDVPAAGYAIGIERLIMAMKAAPKPAAKVVYIATLGDAAKIEGSRLAQGVRQAVPDAVVLTDISEASLKSQMRSADSAGSRLVVIIGDEELKSGKVVIKEMAGSKEQVPVDKARAVEEIGKRLC